MHDPSYHVFRYGELIVPGDPVSEKEKVVRGVKAFLPLQDQESPWHVIKDIQSCYEPFVKSKWFSVCKLIYFLISGNNKY